MQRCVGAESHDDVHPLDLGDAEVDVYGQQQFDGAAADQLQPRGGRPGARQVEIGFEAEAGKHLLQEAVALAQVDDQFALLDPDLHRRFGFRFACDGIPAGVEAHGTPDRFAFQPAAAGGADKHDAAVAGVFCLQAQQHFE